MEKVNYASPTKAPSTARTITKTELGAIIKKAAGDTRQQKAFTDQHISIRLSESIMRTL
jgi:hypothetical protein